MGSSKKPGQAQKINMQVWNLVYPVFLYFAVCQIVNLLLFALPFAVSADAVKRQGLGSFCGMIVLYLCFVKGNSSGSERKKIIFAPIDKKLVKGIFCAVLLLGGAGVALNNMIALTNLKQMSETYQSVEQAFYSSGFGWEILVLGMLTPMAEELLYRYIVFYHLRNWMGRAAAVIGSAFIFGLIHMNVVQGIYAFLLGLLLGLLMEYYQDVRVAIIGHMSANVLALFRGETDLFSWFVLGEPLYVPGTVLLVGCTLLAGLYYIIRLKKQSL